MKAYVRLALVLGLVAVLSGAVYLGAETGWGRVGSVEILLDANSSEQFLFSKIQSGLVTRLRDVEGQWIWKVSLANVLREVEKDKRIREVQITRVFPNRVRVSVTPHQPVLGLADGRGKVLPIATDASLLPAVVASEVPDVPLLRGARFLSDLELRQKALRIFEQLPVVGLFSRGNISEITFDPKEGFEMRLTRSATEVKLGFDDVGQKTSRVEQVLNYLQDQQLQGRVIDARFSKKVVVRLRNGS